MITDRDVRYYIVNHIKVLGLKRGIRQVAMRLGFDEQVIVDIYLDKKRAV
ncbi:hypothetical protein [Geomicrobium sp. JCM 19039]|nr:hypothetical protein [Geomicrobium sp. JCM 19039]